jgi:hypothetical protein
MERLLNDRRKPGLRARWALALLLHALLVPTSVSAAGLAGPDPVPPSVAPRSAPRAAPRPAPVQRVAPPVTRRYVPPVRVQVAPRPNVTPTIPRRVVPRVAPPAVRSKPKPAPIKPKPIPVKPKPKPPATPVASKPPDTGPPPNVAVAGAPNPPGLDVGATDSGSGRSLPASLSLLVLILTTVGAAGLAAAPAVPGSHLVLRPRQAASVARRRPELIALAVSALLILLIVAGR